MCFYTSKKSGALYAWLLMHDWVLTADNLMKKHWPCNEFCALCYCLSESTEHLLTQCNYAEAVWNITADKFRIPFFTVLSGAGGPKQWVQSLLDAGTKKEKKRKLGVLFTFWWLTWKERNNRIF
jgi:hypothetical protein